MIYYTRSVFTDYFLEDERIQSTLIKVTHKQACPPTQMKTHTNSQRRQKQTHIKISDGK